MNDEELISRHRAKILQDENEACKNEIERAAKINGELMVRLEDARRENRKLKDEVKKAKYETALALSETVRVRRYADSLDTEKRELLKQIHDMTLEYRKAERWAKVMKAYDYE